MKTTITFSLPEDKEEYEQAMNVGKYYTAVSGFAQLLQEKIASDEPESEHAKWAYDRLIEELHGSGLWVPLILLSLYLEFG
ncbi:MAG: hypothetical protein H7202_09010 [Pedobacter sp.]|nr:hypothetical protein [Pedobacter sp.]